METWKGFGTCKTKINRDEQETRTPDKPGRRGWAALASKWTTAVVLCVSSESAKKWLGWRDTKGELSGCAKKKGNTFLS